MKNHIGGWVGQNPFGDWEPEKKPLSVRNSQVCSCRPFNLAQVEKCLFHEFSSHTLVFDVFKGLHNMSYASDTAMIEVKAPDDQQAKSS